MIEASAVGRATAALTGSSTEDFCADLDMRNTLLGRVTIKVAFTIGSLTSCAWAVYGGPSASPTTAIVANGVKQAGTLTSSQTVNIVVDAPGCRYLRLGLTGAGTTGASDAVVTYYYGDYLTTTNQDSALKVD